MSIASHVRNLSLIGLLSLLPIIPAAYRDSVRAVLRRLGQVRPRKFS